MKQGFTGDYKYAGGRGEGTSVYSAVSHPFVMQTYKRMYIRRQGCTAELQYSTIHLFQDRYCLPDCHAQEIAQQFLMLLFPEQYNYINSITI